VRDAASQAFLDGLALGCRVAAAVTFIGALAVLRFLPDRPAASVAPPH
jgi:hypothetical protein